MIIYLKDIGGSVISYDDILRKHGKRELKRFQKWIYGQTCPLIQKKDVIKIIPEPFDWVYFEDYARWVHGLPVID